MKKELLVLVIVAFVSIGALLFLAHSENTTGAAVNSIKKIQLERIQEARLGFLVGKVARPCKNEITTIMDLIRINGDSRYYDSWGLRASEEYFTNEKDLFAHLVAVSNTGVLGITGPAAQYMSAANTCPVPVASQARQKVERISQIDMDLVRKTIDNSGCKDTTQATRLYSQAKKQFSDNNYTGMLETLQNAINAIPCK